MLSPLPRRSDRADCSLIHPVVSTFPERVVRSACASTFSGFAQRSLTLQPAHSPSHLYVTLYTEGFSHFVTSMTTPIASGWSRCRVGLTPTGKRRLVTAHTLTGQSIYSIADIAVRHSITRSARERERSACPAPSAAAGQARQLDEGLDSVPRHAPQGGHRQRAPRRYARDEEASWSPHRFADRGLCARRNRGDGGHPGTVERPAFLANVQGSLSP